MKTLLKTATGLLLLLPVFSWAEAISSELRSGQHTLIQSGKVQSHAVNQSYQSDVWFQRIDISLTRDDNANGYFHRLYVEFDADTDYAYQQVFAELSLTPDFGSERIYYTSSVFELFSDRSSDWLGIETDLQQQYPANLYLLTIRLFDAHTGYLLAEASGYDISALDALTLEDFQRDQIFSSSVEVSAGSIGLLLIMALGLLQWRRLESA
ncbi:choice-of-anchor H family protein [Arsukibacterium sp.]|uniref:choice-of-anchor H family protein n=1 Tax=Arsukibacterium sp. TaxID=1977258 RepID=UPI00299D186C|nr:choice-of-anchor H family protein [Arsukibacterium sp.]MDX1676546.1 choice-of-anchor H family protein [Arsukibacterium sp.]